MCLVLRKSSKTENTRRPIPKIKVITPKLGRASVENAIINTASNEKANHLFLLFANTPATVNTPMSINSPTMKIGDTGGDVKSDLGENTSITIIVRMTIPTMKHPIIKAVMMRSF